MRGRGEGRGRDGRGHEKAGGGMGGVVRRQGEGVGEESGRKVLFPNES